MDNSLIRLTLLAVFGISMAHLEGVVVVYLRNVLKMSDSEPDRDTIGRFSKRYLHIEMTREAATIVMLIVIAILAGNSWPERGLLFLWTFAFWDLFYYVFLYLLIKWPSGLKSTDVLFLIPKPWIAPVWLPVTISSVTIIIVGAVFLFRIF